MNHQQTELNKGLKVRHITMISLGGIIGAGLFVGSGSLINMAGPASIFVYAMAGLLVVLVMRMLGEMSMVNPSSGSFSTYAREALGPWAGYTIGWLYWFFWVIVIAVEAIAGANIIQYWFPSLPSWLVSLALTLLLTLTNLYSVKSFGEFEYWLSLIKVVSIGLFLILGGAIIFGFVPSIESPGTSNLIHRGGFIPNGIHSIFLGVTLVMFSFMGSEIVATAAAETPHPEKAITVATNSVIYRIIIFYLGSILVLVTILPWDSHTLLKNPFVSVLEMVNIPAAAHIMNFIVLTAVLSCLNSGLYTSSRMLFALAQNGDAPRVFLKVDKKGLPVQAILGCTVISYISVGFNYLSPDKIFLFLVNASGGVALLVYLVIAFSQLRMRRKYEKENPEALKIRMWLFPYLTYATIITIAGVFAAMPFIDSLRSQFFLTLLIVIFVVGSFFFTKNKRSTGLLTEKKEQMSLRYKAKV
ncbi:amino acid permease [Bacillus sp. ISL-40]|uniref:amino acid permease n=1 Tax=unclassified Bacillus (in: firmicutes) TaxID=185979 RepID=UPI001BEB85A2|nr:MULTISPECIES: amino acid permease [unclassified Bacillus (in: firmicutes)]MBT2698719.1 amino acid permease [Bacillus sp. ISL-40]MBT2740885.1 amino acid permease [Bacillus sp. ISL-77]